jgi:NTE family protein
MASSLSPPDGGTLTDLRALAPIAEELTLQRGDVLVRQGEPSDALYFVLSGRFTVHMDGIAEPVAEIGQGQSIGEIGFFAGLPRTATVMALRDSTVLMVTRERFATIGASSPGMRDAVILSLARRLAQRAPRPAPGPLPVRTVAVVPAGASAPPTQFVEALRDVFDDGRALFLTKDDLSARFPRVSLDDAEISTWLNS